MSRSIQKCTKKFLLFMMAIVYLGSSVNAREKWVHTGAGGTPWFGDIAVGVFKDQIYAAEIDSTAIFAAPKEFLWKSSDGKSWAQSPSPFAVWFKPKCWLVHTNSFYAVSYDKIYKTTDGVVWQQVYQRSAPVNFLVYAISYKGTLFVVCEDGSIFRATETPSSLTMTNVFRFPKTISGSFLLFEYKGFLHALYSHADFSTQTQFCTFFRSENGSSWQNVGEVAFKGVDYCIPRVVPSGETLFLGWHDLKSTNGDQVPYVWTTDSSVPTGPTGVWPFTAAGSVYAGVENVPLMRREPNQTWTRVTDANFDLGGLSRQGYFEGMRLENLILRLPKTDLLVSPLSDIWSFTIGATEVKGIPVAAGSIFAGESGSVMGLSISCNREDVMTLKVNNILGTAKNGTDIESISLVRVLKGVVGAAADQVVSTLVSEGSNQNQWVTPTPVRVFDDDNLFIRVKAAGHSGNAVCRFVVDTDGVSFQTNTDFKLESPIVNLQAVEIKDTPIAAGPTSIKGALVYPQPAKDSVHFACDLDGESNVTVRIFDRQGALVSEITDPGKPAGRAVTDWNAGNIASGIYYAVVKIRPFSGSGDKIHKVKVVIER